MTLEDRLSKDVEGWRPEVGESITGKVTAVDTRDGDYGEYPTVEIACDDGKDVMVHGFHTVLKRELARQRPEPGDTIGIRYSGKDGKKDYERYRVIVEKAHPSTQAPDWAGLEREAVSELQEAGAVIDASTATEALEGF